ncbi:hypothetical protein [Roseovarius sp.]
MSDFVVLSMVTFSVAGLFAGSAALFAFGLGWWIKGFKRWRLIRNAYVEGLRDGKEMKRTEDTPND